MEILIDVDELMEQMMNMVTLVMVISFHKNYTMNLILMVKKYLWAECY
jgi:hypothetical protein